LACAKIAKLEYSSFKTAFQSSYPSGSETAQAHANAFAKFPG